MPTVIDSLIIELGLDPTKFTAEQKKAAEAMRKFREEQANQNKKAAEENKKLNESFQSLSKSLLGLFAIFTAGRGLIEFIKDTTTANYETGRFAKTLDTTVTVLSTWRNVAILTGGTAAGMSGSMKSLVQQFQTFSLTGESSVIPYFRALGINISDANGRMRDVSQIMLDLADRFSKMDPARAAAFGQALGLDPETVNLLILGRKNLTELIEEQKRLGTVSAFDAVMSAKLYQEWGKLGLASESLGRKLLTQLAPILITIIDGLTNLATWAQKHGPLVEGTFYGLAAAAVVLSIALLPISATTYAITAAVLALIAVFALLFDDWKTWMNGGKSVFGDFFSGVVGDLKALVNIFKDAFSIIYDVITGNFSKAGQDFKSFFGDIEDLLISQVKTIVGAATGVYSIARGAVHHVAGAVSAGTTTAPATGAAPVASGSQAESDIKTLMGFGWTRAQATGMAANIQRESGRRGATAVGDNGQAYGISQWHRDRQENFAKWAGHSIVGSTRAEQLAFMNYELRHGTEQGAGRALARTTDAGTAAATVSRLYERPANVAGEMATRAMIAQQLAMAGSHVTTTTNNTININTKDDPKAIAFALRPYLAQHSLSAQSNYGPG